MTILEICDDIEKIHIKENSHSSCCTLNVNLFEYERNMVLPNSCLNMSNKFFCLFFAPDLSLHQQMLK